MHVQQAGSSVVLVPLKNDIRLLIDATRAVVISVVCGSNSQIMGWSDTDDVDWIDVIPFFQSEQYKKVISKIKQDREEGYNILPPRDQILRALATTPLYNVKVVILGQDPYPTRNHPNGLAFSVNQHVTPLPKSLNNIFKELYDDIGVDRHSGDLTDWATQGVLLLNTSLTVREGEPNSHSKIGWKPLIKDVFEYLGTEKQNVVYILWGKHAQQYKRFIDQSNNLVITSPHPSPLSAYRGFFGSKPFSEANKYLQDHNIESIRW